MKKSFNRILIFAYIAILVFGLLTVGATASSSYETFTYSSSGEIQNSPNAYEVYGLYDSSRMLFSRYKDSYIAKRTEYEMGLNGLSKEDATKVATDEWNKSAADSLTVRGLNSPNAVRSDSDGKVYIADTKNNRIVILKNDYTFLDAIDFFRSSAADYDSLKGPKGVFINDSYIYVSDSDNSRIVIFNKSDLSFYKIIGKPDSALIKEADFTPVACAVDQYGRIFVISSTATGGVIVLSDDNGEFNGYIGAQKVTYNLFELFWRRFQTEEQQKANTKNVSVTFNNITIDEDGFIYITTDKIDESKQQASITSKSADYSPVKKLNSAGKHILKRNGFFDCGGEVSVTLGSSTSSEGTANVSKITDVAVGPEGSWSICDRARGRVYTYNSNGELLFAFGDGGENSGSTGKLGSLTTLQSMTYQLAPNQEEDAEIPTYNMLLLDSFTSCLTVFTRTEYGDLLIEALSQENNREYQNAELYWEAILQRNTNFDTAYIGVGKALYRQGKYEEAMEFFRACYETSYYSKAYAEQRKAWISESGHLVLIVVIVVAFIVLVVKGLGAAKKFNDKVALKPGKKTYWEELVYAFYLVFHPFDGFWDLKHEKRGSVRAGLTIVAMTVLAFYYQAVGQGYIFNPQQYPSSIIVQMISVLTPIFLWVTANWCLTTLFDGEGSFRDVLIAVCYSLAPIPPLLVISTLLTNVLTSTEGAIATMIATIAYIWAIFLIFFGLLVTHGYSLPKNIITTIGTIVAVAVLVFVVVLFSSLVGKMIQFVVSIVTEVSSRA